MDDLMIMFLAGNETIKVSSTNLTCYLTQNPGIKAKVLAEVGPTIENLAKKDNLVNGLTTDCVEDFSYLRNCWYEAMRLEPPTPVSINGVFIRPTVIGGVTFDANTTFSTNFNAIHRDPKEWIDPDKFMPERFDSNHPLFKRPNGGFRSPFAFCPFFGGKRICLGRTLAEYITMFTFPLILTHLDFEFINPEHMHAKPNFQLAQFEAPKIPTKITPRKSYGRN